MKRCILASRQKLQATSVRIQHHSAEKASRSLATCLSLTMTMTEQRCTQAMYMLRREALQGQKACRIERALPFGLVGSAPRR